MEGIPKLDNLLTGQVILGALTIKRLHVSPMYLWGDSLYLAYDAKEKFGTSEYVGSRFPKSLVKDYLSSIAVFSLNNTVYSIKEIQLISENLCFILVEAI